MKRMRDMIRLGIITPTIGRNSLVNTLRSGWLSSLDYWIVVGDGLCPGAQAMVRNASVCKNLRQATVIYQETLARTRRFGNPQRDLALSLKVPIDYYLFLDDDDILAIDVGHLKEILETFEGRAGIFKVQYPDGKKLWETKAITSGNVGGSMLVIPAESKIPRWDSGWGGAYISDFAFIQEWVHRNGGPGVIHWNDTVIIKIKPEVEAALFDREA